MLMMVMTMMTIYYGGDDVDYNDNFYDDDRDDRDGDNYELYGTYCASSRFPILGGGNGYVGETAGCVERSIYEQMSYWKKINTVDE